MNSQRQILNTSSFFIEENIGITDRDTDTLVSSRNSQFSVDEQEFDAKYFFVPATSVGSNFIEDFEIGKSYELKFELGKFNGEIEIKSIVLPK